jgi:hypothetical protein
MTHDPLAQFRKSPITPKGGMLPPKESDEYVAFGTKDKVRRLDIRLVPDMEHSPAYNLLLDVVSDGRGGTNFMLVYTVMLVMVKGANLQKMAFAIKNQMADHIQAFDSERWPKPTDAQAAFIDSIEVKVTEGGSKYGDTTH